MPHQWTQGNLPVHAKCMVCDRTCSSVERLQDYYCLWCYATVRWVGYSWIVISSLLSDDFHVWEITMPATKLRALSKAGVRLSVRLFVCPMPLPQKRCVSAIIGLQRYCPDVPGSFPPLSMAVRPHCYGRVDRRYPLQLCGFSVSVL